MAQSEFFTTIESEVVFSQADVVAANTVTPVVTDIKATLDLNDLLSSINCPMKIDAASGGVLGDIDLGTAVTSQSNPLSGQTPALNAFLAEIFKAAYGTNKGTVADGGTVTQQVHVGIDKLMLTNSATTVSQVDDTKLLTELNDAKWTGGSTHIAGLFTRAQLIQVLEAAAINGKSTVTNGANSAFNFAPGDALGSLVKVSMTAGTAVSQDYWRLHLIQSDVAVVG